MHVHERDNLIAQALAARGFVSFQELCATLDASAATIRRDLERLEREGRLTRVRGGARAPREPLMADRLAGTPFEINRSKNAERKAAIGRAAAKLCKKDEAIIIDGGTTTHQMCPHLSGLDIQVLSNSLYIVNELLKQPVTRVLVPGGAIFREQNIILSPFEEDGLERYHASKMFMGTAAIGPKGLMQADVVLVQAERKLMARADKLVVLADSSKFAASASFVLCDLSEVDILVTDRDVGREHLAMLKGKGVDVIVAE
jgi:DeoR family ulaG and ulaABCDEF operon transcriptional repressor